MNSVDLQNSSSAITPLLNEAENHRAVRHPYLGALANGEFKNIRRILQDFAAQYGHYSAWFPRYLNAVISKLENPDHRQHLLDNLAEEKGQLQEEDLVAIRELGIQDDWVQGIPHPQLFRRFQLAMGADPDAEPGREVSHWRESFLYFLENCSPAAAAGAIGLGTESVVKIMYQPLIGAIQKHTDLCLEEYVFFPLHTEVDDEHGLILLNINGELAAQGPEQESELRQGMLKALDLRADFWDAMLERAKILDQA